MYRCLLVTYLTFSMLLGPALCCCTMVPLVESVTAVFEQSAASRTGGNCCHQHATDHRSNRDKDVPTRQDSKCPCKESNGTIAATMSIPVSIDTTVASWSFDAMAEVNPRIESLSAPQARKTSLGISFPYLTGTEILRALHILTC